jgi:epoxyqueuosine reductase
VIDTNTMQAEAQRIGFELLGVAPVEAQGAGWFAPHAERLEAWLDAGFDADMGYIRARLQERVVPETLLPNVRSAVVLWLPNRAADQPRPAHATGRVAAYAWGRDYHNVGRKMLRKFRRWLGEQHPGIQSYVSIDTGAVLERAFGERAAVGWIGKSSMLIHPRLGTYGNIAVVFVDLELSAAGEAHPHRCGTCSACVDQCPTGAIGPLGVDARRCISYWTIEHRGLIPEAMRPAIGDWVFGCDICQDVCPWNHRAQPADAQLWQPKTAHMWPDLIRWVQTPSAELHEAFIGSPLRRARGEGLRRNALIVLANTGVIEALPAIEAVQSHDPDPVLRTTAAWAVKVLRAHAAQNDLGAL